MHVLPPAGAVGALPQVPQFAASNCDLTSAHVRAALVGDALGDGVSPSSLGAAVGVAVGAAVR